MKPSEIDHAQKAVLPFAVIFADLSLRGRQEECLLNMLIYSVSGTFRVLITFLIYTTIKNVSIGNSSLEFSLCMYVKG